MCTRDGRGAQLCWASRPAWRVFLTHTFEFTGYRDDCARFRGNTKSCGYPDIAAEPQRCK
jgi:hypothetical protein